MGKVTKIDLESIITEAKNNKSAIIINGKNKAVNNTERLIKCKERLSKD